VKDVSHYRSLGRRALKAAFQASPFSTRGRKQDSFRVAYRSTGEPAVAGSECRASIAHTRGWGVGAVSSHSIGVDIERVRARAYEKDLIRYITYPKEQTRAKLAGESRARAIAILWVVKESVRKCLGVKRAISPLELVIERRVGEVFFVKWRQDDSWYEAHVRKQEDMYIAVACAQS